MPFISECIKWPVKNPKSKIATFKSSFRSNPLELFLGKGLLKICSKFTEEHPCRSVISIKSLCNFLEITLQHGCSSVNLLHISRTLFLKNTFAGLLLQFSFVSKASFQLQILSFYCPIYTIKKDILFILRNVLPQNFSLPLLSEFFLVKKFHCTVLKLQSKQPLLFPRLQLTRNSLLFQKMLMKSSVELLHLPNILLLKETVIVIEDYC